MNPETLLEIFRVAHRSRRYEERIIELAMAGEIPGSLHPGRGQEVAQSAALAALGADDHVLYGHRGIAYMVARGMELAPILNDIAGREGGTNRGKGGVMHVVDVERGVLGESGTLGGGFVIAAGVGLALKRRRGPVVIHFFGDGTSNRGTFHESLNFCAVQRLPVIFFCENNGWAVSVPASRSTAVANIADRAAGYAVPGVTVDGGDATAVYEATADAVERARRGDGPSLIEAKVHRLMGHYVGDQQPYREDRDTVEALDPLPPFQAALEASGVLDRATLDRFEREAAEAIEEAVATMRAAPPLDPALARADLYA